MKTIEPKVPKIDSLKPGSKTWSEKWIWWREAQSVDLNFYSIELVSTIVPLPPTVKIEIHQLIRDDEEGLHCEMFATEEERNIRVNELMKGSEDAPENLDQLSLGSQEWYDAFYEWKKEQIMPGKWNHFELSSETVKTKTTDLLRNGKHR